MTAILAKVTDIHKRLLQAHREMRTLEYQEQFLTPDGVDEHCKEIQRKQKEIDDLRQELNGVR